MPGSEVRSRRSAVEGDGPVVVVGAGQVAGLLRESLAATGPEARPPGPADVPDVDEPPWGHGVRHLVVVVPAGELGTGRTSSAPEERDGLVERAATLGAAAREHGVEHVVVVTSAVVHGATADRGPIDDDDAPEPGATGLAGDLRAFEDALAAGLDDVPLAVVRPAVVVGPGVDTIFTRHLEAPRLLTVRGAERTWQLLHTDDLVEAVRVTLDRRLTGVLTVGALRDGAPDELATETVAAAAGLRTVQLPATTAFGIAERLYRVGALPSPASDLAFVVYPWTVTARRLHDAGWEPRWSGDEALEVLLTQVRGRVTVGGRRFGGRDAAALGAAGAAVAVVATAAVWRRARAGR
ncbi:nucleoside-diphosphate sugar epimerase [Cellulosimicrobium terreum]|nr:nucleoside-diphosphate sugar epimerase [Cellulosimicrobium terreum]